MLWQTLLLLTQSSLSVRVDADIRRPHRSLIVRTSVSIRVIVPRTWIVRWNLVHELTLARTREHALIGKFDQLKQDYDDLRLRIEGEVHNLSTANLALNQVIATARKDLQLISDVAIQNLRGNLTRVEVEIINHARVLGSAMSAAHYSVLHDDLTTIKDRFKAVGMAYDSLTTFLNQSFNSSRAVTGFVNEQDGIVTQILRYASDNVPGLETFLRSTPAPIPIAANPPPAVSATSAILAGARINSFVQATPFPSSSTPARVVHPLPSRPSPSLGYNGNWYRHLCRKANKSVNSLSKGKGPQ
ncbi:hypothetical protein K435DRAFT_801500 [Dendrothele bispora CBS 962.96]|uniref:Uncharacterized protein n=1 Tax=Dendrothele bispora (strain CBS 962.96) TaxID=1314807 RepID=A0A4S8LP65_DENBC|nr:hypothetical protein K435DRAFT_801500 [Dendrothele bispora CBS 962.96]